MGLLQYGSMDRRFFHRLGASLLDRTICASAGKAGWAAVIGAAMGMDVERYVDSALIVIWGSNAIASNLHFWTRAQEAKRRGARLVAIDPYRSATAEKCHEHIALMPGTDAALAYGIMHILIRDGLVDRDYVDRYTRRLRCARANARRTWTPRARGGHLRHPDRAGRVAGPRLRHDETRRDPSQLRHAARRRRGERRPRRGLPARAGRRVARPRRRRAAFVIGHLSRRRQGARATGPDRRQAAHDQHVDDRRRADVRATAGEGDLRLQQQPPGGRAGIGARSSKASRARICSSSSTSCSRPTPRTTPTSCCRPLRSSSTSTCTTRTATCTCR